MEIKFGEHPKRSSESPIARLVSRAYRGDAFDLFSELPANSVDLIITSPPYWGHREYGLDHNWSLFNDIESVRKYSINTKGYDWYRKKAGLLGLEPYPEWYVSHLAEIFFKAKACLKQTGSLWVNMGDTFFARWSSIRNAGRQGLGDAQRFRRKTPMGGVRQEKQLLLIPARFAIAMQELGWVLRNDVIWYKPNATPRPKSDRLKLSHEHLFHFVKRPKEGRPRYYYDVSQAETRQNDVIVVYSEAGEEGHTATFPEEVVAPRILTSSPQNGVVLDPFCGTGRALVVARGLKRRAIGFDVHGKYVDMTNKKLEGAVATNKRSKEKGNYVSEWFGQRIYPLVRLDAKKLTGRNFGRCPFLSDVLSSPTQCVKNDNSFGVRTISSTSNNVRQDWLVCPYRIIDSAIVLNSCEKIFGERPKIQPVPVSLLGYERRRIEFENSVRRVGRGYVFFQDKLGGEISVSATKKSPEMAFDITIAEVEFRDGSFQVMRYGVLEIQTMDFHGSYRHSVANLRDGLRLHKDRFPEVLSQNRNWAGDRVEGPNIANVFKRTFYQIMLKFKLGGQGSAAGTVLALPKSVWDSWQPFLGRPELKEVTSGEFNLKGKNEEKRGIENSYICVFDLDSTVGQSISKVETEMFIRVSAEALAYHAFTTVPVEMQTSLTETDSILARIRTRLSSIWPVLSDE